MKILTAKILSDESGRPVEVRMGYDEFLRVKAVYESVEDEDNSAALMAFAGKVQWSEDPVEYQRRLRDECE